MESHVERPGVVSVQRATTVWLRKEVRVSGDGLRLVVEPPPGNLNETVNKNVRKGYLMETGQKEGKKAWALTNTGNNFVETGLEHDPIR